MSNFSASIPVANMQAANTTLEGAGYGPNGFTWKVTQADGSGNNVWEPGVFGWTKV